MKMRESTSHQIELRISPTPVLAALVVLVLSLFFGAEILRHPYHVVDRVMSLLLLLCTMAGIGWLLVNWNSLVGRWFTVFTSACFVHLTAMWLGLPEVLTLSALSVASAALLIGVPAAMIAAVCESLLLVSFLIHAPAGSSSSAVVVALIACWATFGTMYGVYHPVNQLTEWMERYFERAQHVLEAARDQSAELKQALESLVNANRQLALANERTAALRAIAESAQKAKTAFVANVSHELRTPLNMIIGLVELMVETPEIYAMVPSPKMRKDLATVHRNCEHLANMINDVLDLTRMDAGRLSLHRERADLREIIGSSIEAVKPLLDKKQLALQVTVPPNLPEIYCDRTRIEQVILNLLSNATRFTEEGGITIAVRLRDQYIQVTMTDTGTGISPDDAGRIFEPFELGTSDLWRNRGGTGLGLSISKKFIELHGGQMWLESEPGVGTSFFFTIPISSPIERIIRPGHQIREDWVWREHAFRTAQAVRADELSRPRIVICDETGALYPQFVRYSDEVELIEAPDLTQAIHDLRECPAHALVLNSMDQDGLWSLIETAQTKAPGTPVIGCSVPSEVARAMDAGALGHLVKPVTRADLERAIKMVGKPVNRVLVVDDEPEVLDLLERLLHSCDSTLEVVTASDGNAALEELRRNSPDLMLLDIVMPDLNGWQVLKAVADDGQKGEVPVLFVSAKDPADEPPVSDVVLLTMHGGLSLSKLLRFSLGISDLLLEPERALDLGPV